MVLLRRLLALALIALMSVPPQAGAGMRFDPGGSGRLRMPGLTHGPAGLVPTRSIAATGGYLAVDVLPGEVVDLTLGPTPRNANTDINGQGGSIIVRDGDLNGRRIAFNGTFDKVIVRNVRSDARNVSPVDILGFNGSTDTLLVVDCRFVGVSGASAGTHGDDIQMRDDANARVVRIQNTTLGSAFQAFIAKRFANGVGVQRVEFDTVNIRDEPTLRTQQSVAVLMVGNDQLGMELDIRNSWIEWPNAALYGLSTAGVVTVSGAFTIGVPPGGDFRPN